MREEVEGEREQSRDTEMHRDTQRYTESRREGQNAVQDEITRVRHQMPTMVLTQALSLSLFLLSFCVLRCPALPSCPGDSDSDGTSDDTRSDDESDGRRTSKALRGATPSLPPLPPEAMASSFFHSLSPPIAFTQLAPGSAFTFAQQVRLY